MIIYIATNKVNNKVYIGQTVTALRKRKTKHLSDSRKGSGLPFHRAIRKYGWEYFTWEIIYHTDNLRDLNAAEECLIAEYASRNKCYNIHHGGNNYTRATETLEKMRVTLKGEKNPMFGRTHSDETKAKIGASSKGRKHSTETRAKYSEARRGKKNCNFGKKLSLETIAKISAANRGKKHSLETRTKWGNMRRGEKNNSFDHRIYCFFHNAHGLKACTKYILAREFSLDRSTVTQMVNGRRKSCKGWQMAANT